MNGGACPDAMAWATADAAAIASGILLRVVPDPVVVLEVDAEILDRLGRELAQHPSRDLVGQHLVDAQRLRQRLGSAEASHSRERLRPPALRQVGGVPIRRDVDGVHGLAAVAITRIPGGEQSVGVGQALVDRSRILGTQHDCFPSFDDRA